MRLDGLEHPKVYHLAAALGVPRVSAIGHLELLWAFTGKNTPQGNIGKWPDGAIARACDWAGDPVEFIDALLTTKLVDECAVERLVVHDWAAHCPNFVRAKLTKTKAAFIVPTIDATITGTNARTNTASSRARRILPSAAQRSAAHVQPGLTPALTPGTPPKAAEWDLAGLIRPGLPPSATDDRERMDAFAAIRLAYPAKSGRAHNWLLAERAWARLIDEGITDPVTLQKGVDRYAAYVEGGGVSSRAYVLGADQFFSAVDSPWSQPWDLPEQLRSGSGRKTFDELKRERGSVDEEVAGEL